MTCTAYECGSFDQITRLQKGVRGYLDYQDLSNKHQYETFAEIFRPANSDLELFFANVLEAAKFATATEIKIRESQRLQTLGRAAAGSEYSIDAQEYNRQAIKTANRARTILKRSRENWNKLNPPERVGRPEFQSTLADARESLAQNLVKFNLSVREFEEVLSIWEEVAATATDKNQDRLFDYLDSSLEKFTALRSEADRGTSSHSPLPWWKYVIIAVYIGAAIFAVIACFWWFACTWVWPAISATAPWIFGIIDRGC
jgi:hypothetical protein